MNGNLIFQQTFVTHHVKRYEVTKKEQIEKIYIIFLRKCSYCFPVWFGAATITVFGTGVVPNSDPCQIITPAPPPPHPPSIGKV